MNVFLSDIPLYDVTRELVLLNQQRIAEIDVAYVFILYKRWPYVFLLYFTFITQQKKIIVGASQTDHYALLLFVQCNKESCFT